MQAQKTPREQRPRNIAQTRSIFDPELSRQAAIDAFKKLDPRHMVRNPVMFVVEVGTVIVVLTLYYLFTDPSSFVYNAAIFLWLLLGALRQLRRGVGGSAGQSSGRVFAGSTDTPARKLVNSREEVVSSSDLRKGDRFVVEAGEIIPADGEIVEGIASVDESAITGESAPVIQEAWFGLLQRDRRDPGALGPHSGGGDL